MIVPSPRDDEEDSFVSLCLCGRKNKRTTKTPRHEAIKKRTPSHGCRSRLLLQKEHFYTFCLHLRGGGARTFCRMATGASSLRAGLEPLPRCPQIRRADFLPASGCGSPTLTILRDKAFFDVFSDATQMEKAAPRKSSPASSGRRWSARPGERAGWRCRGTTAKP